MKKIVILLSIIFLAAVGLSMSFVQYSGNVADLDSDDLDIPSFPSSGSSQPEPKQPSGDTGPTGDMKAIEPTVVIVSAPTEAEAGKSFSITWRIDDHAGTIPHTAIHYDYASYPGDFGTGVAPAQAGYNELTTDYASGIFQVPNTFVSVIRPDVSGTLYYRVHAVVDGKNYWTSERSIAVKDVAPMIIIEEFMIDADDNGFYRNEQRLSSIVVEKGNRVEITFNVLSEGVYFGGLDFTGCGHDTGKVNPGDSAVMEFVAEDTCTVTSFWPSSGVVKDRMQVVVVA